jgi:hypothetical protein
MYNMKRKVIIEALPKAKTGQQVGGSLFNTPALMGGVDRNRSNQQGKATRTIGAVPRDQANLEAEGGETVVGDLTGIGIPQHYTISGPRHAQGGVPMDLPDNSFIFSDFNQMTIKDPVALEYFGKAMKKGGKVKGYTPAEIAKQYDNNKNIEALKNKNSDHLDRKTAELNLSNNNLKLGALALFQEAKKGFENGIPELSYPYLEKLGVNPEEMFGQQEQGLPQAKKGGSVKKLKRKQDGGMMPPPEMMAQEQAMGPEMMDQPGMGQQDPMQEVMMMVQQMMEQGAAPEQVVMELLNNQVPPDVIVEVFIQMGMPQEQAVQIIQAVMSQEQPMGEPGMEQPMDPAIMQGQGMTPDMMPAMDPGMAMMQMGGPNPNDNLTKEIVNALQQGASPEEVVEFLTQQGLPEQEAIQMVMGLMQRANFKTGGELPKAQKGVEPYAMDKAYGPDGIKQLNKMLPESEQLPLDAKPEQVKAKVAMMQKAIRGNYGDLVIDYMLNISEQPNAKLNKLLNEKLGTKNKKYTKAELLDLYKNQKIDNSLILEGFEDQQWWYRMPSAQTRSVTQEEYDKFLKEPGLIKQGDTFYRHIGNGQYETLVANKNNNNQDPDDKDDVVDREDINVPNVEGVRAPDLAEWTAPDIYNFRGAIRDRLGIKSYYPWAARFSPEFMDPTFYDPSRELAASAEQANILTQGMGQFAGPQALSARASQIQGQGAKQAADIMGKYNNLNVGLANQLEGQNTQIANQAQQYNQAKAQELYDKGVITQQQRDNAIRQADATIRQGFQQGWKNASDIAMINANQEQYKVDPFTGTVFHTGVQRPFDPVRQQEDYESMLARNMKLLNDPGAAVQATNAQMRNASGKANFATGGYVLGANMFPFMFY